MSKEAPGRLSRLLQRIDSDPRLVKLLRLGRSRLPGDERYGDPLSLTGDQAREVGSVVEPEICSRGGEIVKRLGDGLMAVFEDSGRAIEAAHASAQALEGVQVDGNCPRLRAGVHAGRPRRIGGDYFGVDVNIAARVAEAAGPGEVLVSEAVHERVEADTVQLKRRWRFSAKGAPKGLKVYAAEPS